VTVRDLLQACAGPGGRISRPHFCFAVDDIGSPTDIVYITQKHGGLAQLELCPCWLLTSTIIVWCYLISNVISSVARRTDPSVIQNSPANEIDQCYDHFQMAEIQARDMTGHFASLYCAKTSRQPRALLHARNEELQ
jgi:hypothetical protein